MKRSMKLIPIVLLGVFLTYLIGSFISQRATMRDLERVKKEKESQLLQVNKEIKDLEDELDQVNTPEFIEKIARDKLKMVGPKDIVYVNESETEGQ